MSERQSQPSASAIGGMNAAALRGLRILVVEDEALVSLELEDMLDDIGCVVAAASASVETALAAIGAQAPLDAAILDVNLGDDKVFPVADDLEARGVPFLFCTGYGPADLAERYPGHPILFKPYRVADLVGAILAARASGGGGGPEEPKATSH